MNNKGLISFINPAGWPFIGIAGFVFLIMALIGGAALFIGLILFGFVIYFFRDPPRTTPVRSGLVVSPADGKIVAITDVVPEKSLGLGDASRKRISIFLNVFDVHVNRSPVDGTVAHVDYREGKFFNASLDKASVDNERNALAITMEGDHPYANQRIGVVQIAGLIARRILCYVLPEARLKAGERFGIIRFGSRTDVYLPEGLEPLVCVGQRVLGGETVLADCMSDEKTRAGEVR